MSDNTLFFKYIQRIILFNTFVKTNFKFFYYTLFYTTIDFSGKHNLMTLSLHEASPGHHYHETYISPVGTVFPAFRQDHPGGTAPPPSTFPSYSVYMEGWGLYSESLGDQMGIYNDPMQK